MDDYRRYAVYFTAAPGPLADFGAAWLGWDLRGGRAVAHPDLPGLPPDRIAALTETPRRYGFHATLKPPFRLAQGSTPAALLADLRALSQRLAPVTLTGGLQLAELDGVLALIPVEPSEPLQSLAADMVRALDRHRAPMTEAERARRQPQRLKPRQTAHLDRWGYPWVMQDFRFHMTLTGRLPQPEAQTIRAALTPHLAPVLPRPMLIDAVALIGEDHANRCHEIERISLNSVP